MSESVVPDYLSSGAHMCRSYSIDGQLGRARLPLRIGDGSILSLWPSWFHFDILVEKVRAFDTTSNCQCHHEISCRTRTRVYQLQIPTYGILFVLTFVHAMQKSELGMKGSDMFSYFLNANGAILEVKEALKLSE